MFIKFPEIDNSYDHALDKFIEVYPQIINEEFIVWEKLDGSNIQITKSKLGETQVCSRNRVLRRDEGFFGIWNVLADNKYKKLIDYFNTTYEDYNLYGEIFGKDIQKRIYYGDKQYLLFYMLRINKHFVSAYEFIDIMKQNGFDDFICPYEIVSNLDSLLSLNIECNTSLNETIEKNIKEGIVFYPYRKIYRLSSGNMFIFKKKSDGYAESCKKKILKIRDGEDLDPKVAELNEIFKTYINRNRILSAFSKEGRISNVKEIGYYHKIIFEDAKKDFIKDYHEIYDIIPFKQKKGVFCIKSLLANMLKDEIDER